MCGAPNASVAAFGAGMSAFEKEDSYKHAVGLDTDDEIG